MKVYFNASPRFKRAFPDVVNQIFDLVENLGCSHTSDFISTVDVEDFYNKTDDEMVTYYKETTGALKVADVVILEMGIPSLALGYLANLAMSLGKPVIALYEKGNDPFFLQGVEDEKLQTVEYSRANLKDVLKSALDYASDQQDTRFNFFISPKISNYLNWVSKTKRIPRAVYLRRLIEKSMNEYEEEYTS